MQKSPNTTLFSKHRVQKSPNTTFPEHRVRESPNAYFTEHIQLNAKVSKHFILYTEHLRLCANVLKISLMNIYQKVFMMDLAENFDFVRNFEKMQLLLIFEQLCL